MKGIDISDCQGPINWSKVKNAGVEFAILRTTRRSGKPDHYLSTNIKNCIEFNIPFDFYKYSYAVTILQAETEAKNVINTLMSYGVLPDKNTVIYMDVEDKIQLELPTKKLTEIVKEFKEVIEMSGYSFGLYMGKYAYEHNELDLKEFDDITWIARYYNGNNPMNFTDEPNMKYSPQSISGTLRGWQYTSSGKVDGITGNVDIDMYFGDISMSSIDVSYYATPEFTLIDALNKIGVDSSYTNRKKIALKNNFGKYSGTKEENQRLYNMLMSGELMR